MRRVLKPVQDSLAGVPSSTGASGLEQSKVSASGRNAVGGGRPATSATIMADDAPMRGGILAAAAAPEESAAVATGPPPLPTAAGGDSLQNLAAGGLRVAGGRRAAASNRSRSGTAGVDTLLLADRSNGGGLSGLLSIRNSDKFRLGNKRVQKPRDTNSENLAPLPEPAQFRSARQPAVATFTSLMAAEVTRFATTGGAEDAKITGTHSAYASNNDDESTRGRPSNKAKRRGRTRGFRGRGRSATTRRSGGGGALGALGMAVPAAIGGDGCRISKKTTKNVAGKGNPKRNGGDVLATEPQPLHVPPVASQSNVVAEEASSMSVLATLDLSMMSLDQSQELDEVTNNGRRLEKTATEGGVLGQTAGSRAVVAKKVSPSPAVPVSAENAVDAMDIDQVQDDDGIAADSLVVATQESTRTMPIDRDVPTDVPPPPRPAMLKSPKSSKKMLKSKRQRKQFSPPAAQIRKVFSAAAAKASAATPSSTLANWGSPSPRPKPSKRMDKKKTPVSKLDVEFMAEESPGATGSSPDASVPMSPIVKAPAPVNSPLSVAKASTAVAPMTNSNAGANKIAGSKVLAVSPAGGNSSQFEANAIATRLFEDVKDAAIRNVLARSNSSHQIPVMAPVAADGSANGSTKGGPGSLVLDVEEPTTSRMVHVAGNEELSDVGGGRDDDKTIQPGKSKKTLPKSRMKKNLGKKESKQDNNSSQGPVAAAVAVATAATSATSKRPRRQAKKVNRLSVSWNDTIYSEKSNKALYDGFSDDNEGGSDDDDDAFAEYERMCKAQKDTSTCKQKQPSPSPSLGKEKSRPRGSLKKGIKSAAAAKEKSSTKAKTRKAANKELMDADESSPGSMWSAEQVHALRKAYHAVEPTSFCFWEDVATGLDNGKTGDQCRDKWFSLVQTPRLRAKKKGVSNSSGRGQGSGGKTPSAVRGDVDDLFQSTPYRRVNVNIEDDGYGSRNSCDESEGLIGDDDVMLPCDFGSPISHSPSKMVNQAADADEDDDLNGGHDVSPIHFRTGYKGYIKGLAKIRRRNGGKLRGGANAALTPAIKDKSGRNVSAKIGAGDVQMNGVLTPGGTVQVRAPTDSDLEDLVIRPGEEYSDDEESIAKENAELEM